MLNQPNIGARCAFGQLVRRWGILWRPLECSLQENTRIVMVCMKLHNYCQRRGFYAHGGCRERGEVDGAGASPEAWLQNDLHMDDSHRGVRRDLERSAMRTCIAEAIYTAGLRRPARSETR